MVNHPSALILAAGLGKRMKSDLPKVLHRICGKSLAEHVLLNLADTPVKEIGIVVGHKQELVEETLGTSYSYYQQKEQLGTAHAVLQAQDFLKQHPGRVLILCGDAPLQTGTCLNAFLSFCEQQGLDLGVLTAILEEPGDYGRIIREGGVLRRITEKKDCSEEELKIKEINAGTYCFDSEKLLECLSEIQNQNSQNEYYLTDAVALFLQKGYRTDAYVCDDPDVVKAVNTPLELQECESIMRSKINRMHTENGVRIIDPLTVYIDRGVSIEGGTEIWPNTIITGETEIGADNLIIASRIDTCTIGNRNHIDTSTLEQSIIENKVQIGPYAHIRPDSIAHDNVRIGNFVEIKKSVMEQNSKASHLTYVGDAEVGENVNLGCGTVFVNYDGKNKHKTIVKKNSFIGCNANLIAPITIGENVYVAAGSTVTEDIPDHALAIARSRMTIKQNWAKKDKS